MSTLNAISQEIDSLIQKTFSEIQLKDEDMKKSFDENLDMKAHEADIDIEANGGGDIIKNKDEKEKGIEEMKKKEKGMMKDKKMKEDMKEEKMEKEYKSKDKMMKDKKMDMDDEEEDMDDEEMMEKEKDKKKDMKKSFEIDEDDYALLIKARKEKAEQDRLEKSKSDPLYKSVEGLTQLIKGLNDKINDLQKDIVSIKKSPARDPKSLDGSQIIEKSQNSENDGKKFKKSQVLEVMLDLQKSNNLVNENHIIEYEAVGSISNPEIRNLVNQELKKRF